VTDFSQILPGLEEDNRVCLPARRKHMNYLTYNREGKWDV
jgi:hypothetical protein